MKSYLVRIHVWLRVKSGEKKRTTVSVSASLFAALAFKNDLSPDSKEAVKMLVDRSQLYIDRVLNGSLSFPTNVSQSVGNHLLESFLSKTLAEKVKDWRLKNNN